MLKMMEQKDRRNLVPDDNVSSLGHYPKISLGNRDTDFLLVLVTDILGFTITCSNLN